MRRSSTILISREGRDKGKSFVIEEMPAIQATEWFLRALQLMARSGADVPPNIMQVGVAGFAALSIGTILTGLGKAPFYDVKPLLDELRVCIKSFTAAGGTAPVTIQAMILQQIEESATDIQLLEEVVSLHLGFSIAERMLTYRAQARAWMDALGRSAETSTEPSPPSSAEGSASV